MPITITQAVARLLEVVKELHAAYPNKQFTLDGRLVGDLGEILVAEAYEVDLLEGLAKYHDARCPDGRNVQIKATMKDALTFPADHVPDFYLGIQINPDGTFSEVFNGPGSVISQSIEKRKAPKTNLHSIGVPALCRLNLSVHKEQKIPLRPQRLVVPVEAKGVGET